VCLYTKYNLNASRVEFNQSLDNAEFVWVSFSVLMFIYVAVTIHLNHCTIVMIY